MKHIPVDHVSVTNNSSNLRVAVASLRTFVDVRAANDGESIVHDQDLRVYVDLFRGENITSQLAPIPQREHGDIVIMLNEVFTDVT